jgi:hypothetical protein
MKTLFLLILTAFPALAHNKNIPDIPPDASSTEYRRYLARHPRLGTENDGLDPVVRAGERTLQWLDHINSFRPEGEKLSLSSKETQRGYPIDQPNEYSPSLIQKNFAELKDQLPAEMVGVILENKPFTREPPLPTEEYLSWSRRLDRAYQSSARWRAMSGWLPILESRRSKDIRGYYFFSRLEGKEEKLKNFAQQSPALRQQIKEALAGMCLNRFETIARCQKEVEQKIGAHADLLAYYRSMESRSADTYNSFFTIPSYAARDDFFWEAKGDGNTRLIAPFTDPQTPEVRRFLQDNIQDEWRWGNWSLELPFTAERGHPYVVFVPGVVPNVNGLGGDRITMDANQPLTEYDAQWTIRHEFGHVLGLPDCYVEFYAAEKRAIVNYQIDVENIMCSRRGHIKDENVRELERAYKR